MLGNDDQVIEVAGSSYIGKKNTAVVEFPYHNGFAPDLELAGGGYQSFYTYADGVLTLDTAYTTRDLWGNDSADPIFKNFCWFDVDENDMTLPITIPYIPVAGDNMHLSVICQGKGFEGCDFTVTKTGNQGRLTPDYFRVKQWYLESSFDITDLENANTFLLASLKDKSGDFAFLNNLTSPGDATVRYTEAGAIDSLTSYNGESYTSPSGLDTAVYGIYQEYYLVLSESRDGYYDEGEDITYTDTDWTVSAGGTVNINPSDATSTIIAIAEELP